MADIKNVSRNALLNYEFAINNLLRQGDDLCRLVDQKKIQVSDDDYKIQLLQVGSAPDTAPTLVFVAGVHGLESIGIDILINYLSSLIVQCEWSVTMRTLLQRVRLFAIPMLNPSGVALKKRGNAHGVDLMRNAPIDAKQKSTWLVGGHRYTRFIPWYRGRESVLEAENKVLFDWCNDVLTKGPCTIVVDLHSGFGARDQIWYPYAGSKEPFPRKQDIIALKTLFDKSYPHHHHYVLSQQSAHYITHGDLWDWIFDHRLKQDAKPFLPLTLELGSWLWLKKNPRQLLKRKGLFHPIVAHRRSRVLRQHFLLFDFLLKASEVHDQWVQKKDP